MTTEEDSPADAEDAAATESDASRGETDASDTATTSDTATGSDTAAGSDAASAAREDAEADGIESRLAGGPDGLADPRDGLQNPADNVPRPEVPDTTPDAPEAPSTDEVPEGLRAEFWELVFAANVALFGLSLGAMLVGFQENVPLGALSLLVGGLAGLFLVLRYRNRQHTP